VSMIDWTSTSIRIPSSPTTSSEFVLAANLRGFFANGYA
jgi:hypothetical protein